ncbi:hypothetical protein F8388_027358 [Cannabis sativa]|uniref:Uncharacterized protein n=1 Tax=Cannabis sativa TaxID=3483 RepID=A0A7J6DNW0_CANSA|nr:hypothetical protein F8388_027358 [Cannabis sativa]
MKLPKQLSLSSEKCFSKPITYSPIA